MKRGRAPSAVTAQEVLAAWEKGEILLDQALELVGVATTSALFRAARSKHSEE